MGKPAFDLRDSPSLMLAQRIACSSFALAMLPGDYREGHSNWIQLEPRLAALRRPANPGGQVLKAKAFRDAWRLRHRLQTANVEAMSAFGVGPTFLPRVARLESVSAADLRRDEYVATLLMAGLALEWMRPEPKASIQSVKRDRALQVLDKVLLRWKPARDCRISLPAFEFAGLTEHLAQVFAQSNLSREAIAARVKDSKTNLAAYAFRPSPRVATRFPSTDPYRAVDYLLRLALDEKPLSDPALLRWSFDLVSAVLATEALFLCDAENPDFGTFHRKRADAVLGLAQIFFCEIAPTDIPRQIRTTDLVSLVDPKIPDARRLAFMTSFVAGWTQFRSAMKSWTVDFGWYRLLWDQAHGRLPADGFTRLGRPPEYVVKAGRAWGLDRPMTITDLPANKSPEHWDSLIIEQIRAKFGSQLDKLKSIDPPRAQVADRVFDLAVRLAGELKDFGARFKPGYSMKSGDYDALVREVQKGQVKLAQTARLEFQRVKALETRADSPEKNRVALPAGESDKTPAS
jgi:hypothetical protein